MHSSYGGLFQDHPLITTDADPAKTDPYLHHQSVSSRHLGHQFSTQPTLKGKIPSVYLEGKYLTLVSREQFGNKDTGIFIDSSKFSRWSSMDDKQRRISDKDFIYSSYIKKSTGPGSFAGCFQSKPFPYLSDSDIKPTKAQLKAMQEAELRRDGNQIILEPRNIMTNHGKKGTYGYPNLSISRVPADQKTSEKDPYESLRSIERANWEASKAKFLGGPLVLRGVASRYFDEKHSTGVSGIYESYDSETLKGKGGRGRRHKGTSLGSGPYISSFHPDQIFAFRNAAHFLQGDAINKFQNTWMSSEEIEALYSRSKRHRKVDNETKSTSESFLNGPWKVASYPETSIITSLLSRYA